MEPKSVTLTRADLAQAVFDEVGLSQKNSNKLVKETLDLMLNNFQKGESIKISGFGNFNVRHKNKREGRNPKTGEAATISARRVLVFRPSHILRDKVNSG